jgi:hypothetical protein
MKKNGLSFIHLASLGLLAFAIHSLHQAEALFLDPVRIEITAPPGAGYQGHITLRNDQPEPLTVEVSFHDDSTITAEWLQLKTGIITLIPHKKTIIPYTVSIPSTAKGEFRGRFAFSEAASETGASSVSLVTRIAVPIYVVVRGTEKYGATIKNIQVDSTSPLSVSVSLENHGNVHIRPEGRLVIVDDDINREVAQVPINPLGYPIFPGLTDELIARNDQLVLPQGTYQLHAHLSVDDVDIQSTTNAIVP